MGRTAIHLVAVVLLMAGMSRLACAQSGSPLHARIDRAIEAGQIGPASPLAGDEEFLRRAYLDLAGSIPPVEEARAFLQDRDRDKRRILIDHLLAGPLYARHMASLFDITFMERRAATHVNEAAWKQYLCESFLANKPYNQLVKEILEADGVDESQRGRARFYLDRDADPFLLTRDIGRVFFGRDLQCAQCHNHPLIDGYRQEEYHGLLAFLNRSFLFKAKEGDKEKALMAEKAESSDVFKSAFKPRWTVAAQMKLPGGLPVTEPQLSGDEAYQVKPANNVRPIPKHSRRQKLAERVGAGDNRQFARTIANRLWAMMMGRGLVHPLDLDHPQNPPSHPQLLEMLTDAMIAMKYDTRAFVRELALSQTYQRSVEMPSPQAVLAQADSVAARLSQAQSSRPQLQKAVDEAVARVDEAEEAYGQAKLAIVKLSEPQPAATTAAQSAQKEYDEAKNRLAEAQSQWAARKQMVAALSQTIAKIQEAIGRASDGRPLEQAVQSLAATAQQWTANIGELEKNISQLDLALKAAQGKLATAQKNVQQLNTGLVEAGAAEAAASARLAQAVEHRGRRQSALQQIEREIVALQSVVTYRQVAAKAQAVTGEVEKAQAVEEAERTRRTTIPHWTGRFAAANLKPLSPEQLGWSMMEATGVAAQFRQMARAELEKQRTDAAQAQAQAQTQSQARPAQAGAASAQPQPLIPPPPPLPPLPAKPVTEEEIERLTAQKLDNVITTFVQYYGAGAGQPQDGFSATVDQALFLANNGTLQGWLVPAGDYLIARLARLQDPSEVARELYLSVLTRYPADHEMQQVREYLAPRTNDRNAACVEMAWGLISSAEFRFNH